MSTAYSDALIKVAESLERLATSIEEQNTQEKTALAAQSVPDFGSLSSNSYQDQDALTRFLLGS